MSTLIVDTTSTSEPPCFEEPAEKYSIYDDCQREIDIFRWIESQREGRDLGEAADRRWVKLHWHGFLRFRWLQHLAGDRFWLELDCGDFGLLRRQFHTERLLLDRILDRLSEGHENLGVICWARTWHLPVDRVLTILEVIDINSKRLRHKFED